MAAFSTIDEALLTDTPNLPWPAGQTSRTMVAVKMRINWGYVDTIENVPTSLRGRMRPDLKEGGRFMLYKDEPGYRFSRNNGWTLAIFFRAGQIVPVVVPDNVLIVGKTFRTLTQQSDDHLPTVTVPNVTLQFGPNDTVFVKFVRTFWRTVANQSAQLRALDLQQSDIDDCFAGDNLRNNVDSILSAFLPGAQQVFSNVNFTLRDVLALRHLSDTWPGNGDGTFIYMRIYTHPSDKPDYVFRDATQDDIDVNVGWYIGQSTDIQHRDFCHERIINSGDPTSSNHYRIARLSSPEHRHTIPVMQFRDANVPMALLNMAEETVIAALCTYHKAMFAPAPEDSNMRFHTMQRRAQVFGSAARSSRHQVGWPTIRARGCNCSSPLFEVRRPLAIHCIPMAPADTGFIRTFTTYRIKRNVQDVAMGNSTQGGGKGVLLACRGPNGSIVMQTRPAFPTETRDLQGPKPHDAKAGYLVAEIMDDKKPHARAWAGVPTVGPFKDFDRASSIALRFEWFDRQTRKWYSVFLQRHKVGQGKESTGYIGEGNEERLLPTWRTAMNLIQAFEGTVYTGTLNGFHKELSIGLVQRLETDHLKQIYRWVPQLKVTTPAPARATWQENFNLMERHFGSSLTFVGPTQPLKLSSDVMNRATGDDRKTYKHSDQKCDSCNVFGAALPCVQDETNTNAWVCKTCSLLNRPCTFTAWSEFKRLWGTSAPFLNFVKLSSYPTGPHKHLAFHRTMNPTQLAEIREVPKPLFEKLGSTMDDGMSDGEEEDDGDVGGDEIAEAD